MRISCNGCRVLRKGCSDTCTIRPCLDWIKNPDFQANATVFLAKFYGRAGLVNLINAGPQHLRPAIFSSLLYEACGRIVNPIYGSAGLLSSGNWNLCQEAVDAVLKGDPITPMEMDAAEETKTKAAYDIRHVNRKGSLTGSINDDLHQVRKRRRFKGSGAKKAKRSRVWVGSTDESGRDEAGGSPSHESSLSHQSEVAAEPNVEKASRVTDGLAHAEPDRGTKPCLESGGEVEPRVDDEVLDLDLTLGLKPVMVRLDKEPRSKGSVRPEPNPEDGAGISCKIELGLDYPAS